MKHMELSIIGLMLPLTTGLADQTSEPACVEALEQLATLKTVAPVYKLSGDLRRDYLPDAKRPAEVDRIRAVVAASCSASPKHRMREESEAKQLHLARSPNCMQDRDRLAMMERKDARTPEDDLERTRKRVQTNCPDLDYSNVWLVEWIPPPVPPNNG